MNKQWEAPVVNAVTPSIAEKKLKELFDGLVMENIFGLQEQASINDSLTVFVLDNSMLLQDLEAYWVYGLGNGGTLVARVTTGIDIQSCRLSRGPLYYFHPEHEVASIDDALGFMKCLAQYANQDSMPDLSGLDSFMHDLALAQAQSAWSAGYTGEIAKGCGSDNVSLHLWEQLSALRDRPFHPLAKAKKGWNAEQFREYAAEASHGFGLAWVAVDNQYLIGHADIRGEFIAKDLLNPVDQEILWDACKNQAIDCSQHTLIPVHPWHFRVHLQQEFKQAIASGHIRLVTTSLGVFNPTASGRSLIPLTREAYHVKLPLALMCLGALRILPPRYLYNGYQAQQMLAAAINRMPGLEKKIQLCDESHWVAYLPSGDSLLSNQAGYLSCLIRRYPDSETAGLIPMAALSVEVDGKVPALELLYRQSNIAESLQHFSINLFTDIAKNLCEFSFHCFSLGLMPEVHGQNLLIKYKNNQITQLVLRDHDTLRIFPPWLNQQKIPLQEYQMDWSTPNSLICLSPQQLLSYFLTLGVQVNLLSIADALSRSYDISMARFWTELKIVMEQLLNEMEIPVMTKAMLRKDILDNNWWPSRQILSPCLVKRTRVMGMPSAMGSVSNPFHRLTGEWNL